MSGLIVEWTNDNRIDMILNTQLNVVMVNLFSGVLELSTLLHEHGKGLTVVHSSSR